MDVRWLGLVVVMIGVAGCAGDGGSLARQAIPDYSRFSHSWAAQHVTLYWDCAEAEEGVLRIEGVGVNQWEPVPPEFLDLNLFGLDAQGRVLSRVHGSAEGAELVKNFPSPFRLELRQQGGEVRVELAYRYWYLDDSFDGPFRRLPTYVTGRIPDACGHGGRIPQK